MRDLKVIVSKYNDLLITVARYTPVEQTIIVKNKNEIVETLSVRKEKASGLLGVVATVPREAPVVVPY